MPNAQGQASAPRPIKGHSRSGAQRRRAGPCPGRAAIPLWRPRAAPTAKGQVSAPLLVRAKLSRRPRAHRIRAGLLKGAAQDPGPAQSKGQTQRPALTAAKRKSGKVSAQRKVRAKLWDPRPKQKWRGLGPTVVKGQPLQRPRTQRKRAGLRYSVTTVSPLASSPRYRASSQGLWHAARRRKDKP